MPYDKHVAGSVRGQSLEPFATEAIDASHPLEDPVLIEFQDEAASSTYCRLIGHSRTGVKVDDSRVRSGQPHIPAWVDGNRRGKVESEVSESMRPQQPARRRVFANKGISVRASRGQARDSRSRIKIDRAAKFACDIDIPSRVGGHGACDIGAAAPEGIHEVEVPRQHHSI
ncbi:MAG: hypothetical protein MUF06_18760 [Pirellulaceae bacterium]|nr:hypothetical protein [Pirellulaceae bacterium]